MDLYDRQVNGLTFQTSRCLEKLGVPHGFTTRTGGVSAGIYESLNLGVRWGDDPANIRENYRRVCEALEVDITKLILCPQVHGDVVHVTTAADAGLGLDIPHTWEADALITDVPGLTLTVFGADCLTVLFYDPVHRAAGAAHAGWRGTANGIVEKTVARMTACYGTDPADLLCVLGPCIDRECFETDADVPDAMTAALGEAALPYIADHHTGKYHVDLKGLNTLRLLRSGVREDHIDISSDCTLCKPEKYWSHRYTKGQRGSQVSLICLPEAAP